MVRPLSFIAVILIIFSCHLIACSKATDSTTSLTDQPAESEDDLKSTEPAFTPSIDDEKELNILEKKYMDNPDDYPTAYNLARKYEQFGKIQKALDVFSGFLESDDPQTVGRAKLDSALVLTRTGKHKSAYKKLLEVSYSEIYELKAEAFYQLGTLIVQEDFIPPEGNKTETAIKYFRASLELDNSNPILYRRLADLMYTTGELEEARELMAIFLVAHPDDALGWLFLADWSVEAKDIKRAREYYERAIKTGNDEISSEAERALVNLK